MFINQLLTMGLPAIDDSLMRLLTAMETFPKSAVLGSAISFAKMLGLLLALCMGSYECWMMMLGRRGMDVMKLARIIGLSLCITYSSYICTSLRMPGKGLEEVTRQMAQSKNKEVAALELKVAQKQHWSSRSPKSRTTTSNASGRCRTASRPPSRCRRLVRTPTGGTN